MQIVMVPLSDIKPYDNNPRKNAPGVAAVAKSMREFGVQAPILLDKDRVIVYGHTRLEAAKENGMAEYPCIIAEDLTPEKARAYRIADNHVATHSEWDEEKLKIELEALKPFEFKELPLIEMAPKEFFPNTVSFTTGDKDPDEVPPLPKEEPKSRTGNIWALGNHRLMCGDSLSPDNVSALLAGQKTALCFTSPPYNVGKSATLHGNTHMADNKYKSHDDSMSQDDYLDFLKSFTQICLENSRCSVVNIQQLAGNKIAFIEYLHHFRNHLIDTAIWDKGHAAPAMAANVMSSRFEYLLMLSDQEKPSRAVPTADFRGTVQNVYQGPPQRNNEFSEVHSATFPVHLPNWVISSFSKENDLVFEPFGGTGTTMIACEQIGRHCYSMEIDPIYCDVIVSRWEKFSGKTAELIS